MTDKTAPIVIEIAGDSPLADALRECADYVLRTPAAEGEWLIRQGVENLLRDKAANASQKRAAEGSHAWTLAQKAGLSEAAAYALMRSNLSPDDVARMTDTELMSVRSIGERRLAEIRAVIPHDGNP